jgi:chaperonin GroEL
MNESGYTPKNLKFGKEGRDKLINGIKTISGAVKSTLGPSGQTVLIESPNHTHGITVTKDGVTVAKAVSLIDPVENLAVRMMKEAADRTASSAGDGTTTAIVLTEAMVLEGMKVIDDTNKTEVLRDMVKITEYVVKDLKRKSKKVTKKNLKDVATISANNDPELGKIISDVYKEVGENGIVTVDRSQTSETYYESTRGIKVDRGYSSPLFINDQKKDECILEDTYVLVSDAEIANILNIETILKPIIQENKKLLIIAPCSTNVLNTLAANVMKSNLKVCVVQPPNFGYKQHELMQDIAISVGATYFSEKTGDDLSIMTMADLGHAAKIIAGDKSTIIINDEDTHNEVIDERVEQLWEQHKNAANKDAKEFILSRIASLTGGIGVIYAGGKTDLEQKELYDRIDDAVCAVRSALEEGIVTGGGLALWEISIDDLDWDDSCNSDAVKIMGKALKEPLYQIIRNAGGNVDDITNQLLYTDNCKYDYDDGYNAKTGEFGNMYKMGVIDPLKVTKNALQNAVSVAVTILSTNAIITMARSYEEK